MTLMNSPFSRLAHPMSGKTDGYELLVELALDLRWSWSHKTDELWKELDPVLWELTRNPWAVLQTVSWEKLESLLSSPAFRERLAHHASVKRQAGQPDGWFHSAHPQSPLTTIAYFSMEFMLSEALPIYSGGLGNVAGDQLKAASDLGVPVVGVGLLYQQGYFRQILDAQGNQQALYPFNDPGQLPVTPVRHAAGEWLRLEIKLPGYSLWLRAWEVQVGRVKLYLLDSNDIANSPIHRGITSELYGGDSELRLRQEIILGIGGWRLLEAVGLRPEVCHLNEGHAAFAVLERAAAYMRETSHPFDVALNVTRAGNLFTTHTAVEAGFDRFSPALMEHYLGRYAHETLGIAMHDLLALGRRNAEDIAEFFNMAYLAVRSSGAVNAVSRLHGEVSRRIFAPLFPRWPVDEIPVGYVTNGVHMPTWDSKTANDLWTETCGQHCWHGRSAGLEKDMSGASDKAIWNLRSTNRAALVHHIRIALPRQWAMSAISADKVEKAKQIFHPDALTLGFARRFATYKRPNLLLHDRERLARILSNAKFPVQLVMAGKAHPADQPGQALVREWVQFARRSDVEDHVVFLGDYDMLLAQRLVQGVDVWINTPERPWEASGTSGMKVLVNGGLNLSELDGWWAEAYQPNIGWAIGDGSEHGCDPQWDAAEAELLYDLLEHQVVPEFYRRNDSGVPNEWIARIRQSMATLAPRFSACRTVQEYTDLHYLPAAINYSERAAQGSKAGKIITALKNTWHKEATSIRFSEMINETRDGHHHFSILINLHNLKPEAVRVELLAERSAESEALRLEMRPTVIPEVDFGNYRYVATIPANRAASDFTPRVFLRHDGLNVPLEAPQIVWQH